MYGVCVCDDDGSPCQRHSIELIIGIRPGPSGVQSVGGSCQVTGVSYREGAQLMGIDSEIPPGQSSNDCGPLTLQCTYIMYGILVRTASTYHSHVTGCAV